MPYIGYFPQPFLDDLIGGIVLPYIGAGLSRNAIPPLPGFDQLATEMAQQIPDYTYRSNPIDTMSAYEQAFGRIKLIETLARYLLAPGNLPGPTIEALARLPFNLAATTNFEFLLEQAYQFLGRRVYPLVEEEQLPLYPFQERTGVYLLKIHGDFAYPSRIIVTEEDYDAFVTRYPLYSTYLSALFAQRTLWFIGSSLNDYDFRFILRFVTERLGRFHRMAYSIQVNASAEEVLRFQRRDVRVINLPGDPAETGTILAAAFEELRSYWLKQLLQNSLATNPEVAAALGQSQDRLCLFAIPREKIALFREQVFPAVRELGMIPAVADDLFLQGSSTEAKSLALAERAATIVELTEPAPLQITPLHNPNSEAFYTQSGASGERKAVNATGSHPKILWVSGAPAQVVETLRQRLAPLNLSPQ